MWLKTGLLVVIVAFFATPSFACSCFGPGPCQASGGLLASYATAFVGVAVFEQRTSGIQNFTLPSGEVVRLAESRDSDVTFRITESLKGTSGTTVIVSNPSDSCHSEFEPGVEYLVFVDAKGTAMPCAQIGPARSSVSRIEQLRAVRDGLQPADVVGLVSLPLPFRPNSANTNIELALAKAEPAPSIRVTAKSTDAEYSTRTTSAGIYEFRGLPSGQYQIVPELPSGCALELRRQTSIVNVSNGAACRADFQLHYDGRISGAVIDSRGQSMSGYIVAHRAEPDHSADGTIGVDFDGRFEFTTLHPGRYRFEFVPKVNGRLEFNSRIFPKDEVVVVEGSPVEGLRLLVP